jgi:hypothetical protein
MTAAIFVKVTKVETYFVTQFPVADFCRWPSTCAGKIDSKCVTKYFLYYCHFYKQSDKSQHPHAREKLPRWDTS